MVVGTLAACPRVQRWPLRSLRLCVGVGTALLLCACSLGPAYRKPAIPAPVTWAHAPADARAAWPSADWWHGFASPQLDALIAQAQRANDDIVAAAARVREADAQMRIAGAPLLPSLGASAVAQRERSRSSSNALNTRTAYTPQLSASYELDFWGENRAALHAAEALAAASRYERETVELTVVSDVASTYFQVLALRERLRIAQENLASAQTMLDDLKLTQVAGTGNALDVAQQETVRDTLHAGIPPLRQQLHQTIDALAILTGQAPEALQISTGALTDLSAPVVHPGLPSALLARRPDVASAEARLIAANADIAQARAAFFPNIVLTASGGYASSALAGLLSPEHEVFSLAASLVQPIFAGGALQGQSDYAEARYAELLAGYRKTVIGAFADVEDALIALQQTGEQLQRQQQAVAAAQRAYAFAQAQLRAGTIDVLTLLNTEGALFGAEDSMAQIRLAHFRALIGLFNALGGGWQNTVEE